MREALVIAGHADHLLTADRLQNFGLIRQGSIGITDQDNNWGPPANRLTSQVKRQQDIRLAVRKSVRRPHKPFPDIYTTKLSRHWSDVRMLWWCRLNQLTLDKSPLFSIHFWHIPQCTIYANNRCWTCFKCIKQRVAVI